jgi:hypothetical protein
MVLAVVIPVDTNSLAHRGDALMDKPLLGESDLKVRYLVIDTGGWLSGRKVLLSTAWLSSVAPNKKALVVNIDKKRIEESPLYDPDAEIPREYETRLHDHYGLPYYWQ